MFKDLASIQRFRQGKTRFECRNLFVGPNPSSLLLLASFVEGFFFRSLLSPTKTDHKKYVLNTGSLSHKYVRNPLVRAYTRCIKRQTGKSRGAQTLLPDAQGFCFYTEVLNPKMSLTRKSVNVGYDQPVAFIFIFKNLLILPHVSWTTKSELIIIILLLLFLGFLMICTTTMTIN